jgi:gamma-glutamyltranspeptidase/glutathione hydrolase
MSVLHAAMEHNSIAYLHTLIEALRLSFKDASTYVADPTASQVPTSGMLSKKYAAERRLLINPDR